MDENIARGKIVSCEADHQPPKKKAKDVKRDVAIKTAVLSYQKAAAEEAEKKKQAEADLDSDDEPEQQEDAIDQRQKWLNSAAFALLKAIAHNTTL